MRIVVFAFVVAAAAGAGLYGYSHYQGREQARQLTLGRECSTRLSAIYEACERLALESHAGGQQAWPEAGPAVALDPYLEGFKLEDGCPAGGAYQLGDTLTDKSGHVVPPTCPHATEKLGRSDPPNGERALHARPAEPRPTAALAR